MQHLVKSLLAGANHILDGMWRKSGSELGLGSYSRARQVGRSIDLTFIYTTFPALS